MIVCVGGGANICMNVLMFTLRVNKALLNLNQHQPPLSTVTIARPAPLQVTSDLSEVLHLVLKSLNLGKKKFNT